MIVRAILYATVAICSMLAGVIACLPAPSSEIATIQGMFNLGLAAGVVWALAILAAKERKNGDD